jgi:molybdopterin-guanine dinucleotide biosynthesis protein A
LAAQRNPFKLATAYVSANDGFPEPLCAIYEPKSVFRLMQFLAFGYHCPRKVLINSDTWLLELAETCALDNVNTPAERDTALGSVSFPTAGS